MLWLAGSRPGGHGAPWPWAFTTPSESQWSVRGCATDAPHAEVVLRDCWRALSAAVLTLDVRKDANPEAAVCACWGSRKRGCGLASLPRGLFPQKGKSSGRHPSASPTGGNRKGEEDQVGLPGGQCFVLGGAQGHPCVSFPATREQAGPLPGSLERLRGLLSARARFSKRLIHLSKAAVIW